MSTYVVAQIEPPAIVCPPWCAIPVEEHLADLEGWEGMVIHWSSERELCPGLTVRLAATATPAGALDPEDPPHLHIYEDDEQYSFPDAVRAAAALAELMKEAQA